MQNTLYSDLLSEWSKKQNNKNVILYVSWRDFKNPTSFLRLLNRIRTEQEKKAVEGEFSDIWNSMVRSKVLKKQQP